MQYKDACPGTPPTNYLVGQEIVILNIIFLNKMLNQTEETHKSELHISNALLKSLLTFKNLCRHFITLPITQSAQETLDYSYHCQQSGIFKWIDTTSVP